MGRYDKKKDVTGEDIYSVNTHMCGLLFVNYFIQIKIIKQVIFHLKFETPLANV